MAALGQDFQPITDMRASAGYRLPVARNLLRRLHVETTSHGRDPSRRRPEPRPCLTRDPGRRRTMPRAHDSARRHVTGEALYIDDMPEPAGLLHVQLGLSTKAHARIVKRRPVAGARGRRASSAC